MSRLDELIAEMCPDGVEYVPLRCCLHKVENIKWKTKPEGDYQYIDLTSVDRDTHLISETQTINYSNAPSRAQQIVKTGDILLGTTRPMLKRYCMIPESYSGQICSTGFCVLRANKEIVLSRWLYHYISSSDFFNHVEIYQRGASYPAISDTDVKLYEIPLPPLEVQREIVRILDAYSERVAELTDRLAAELDARKRQYEYYQDGLLTFTENHPFADLFPDGVEFVALNSICDIYDGTHQTPIYTESGIKFVSVENIRNLYGTQKYISEKDFQKNYPTKPRVSDVLMTRIGSIGDCALVDRDEDLAYYVSLALLRPNQKRIDSRYLIHAIRSKQGRKELRKWTLVNAVPIKINKGDIGRIQIPLPSLEVQERIVSILDRFDKLCNDITLGLPAEIEARRKQYEHYRDRLLTFKEIES